jgi:lipopolysaccharide biosynthesis glycosyltransferase
MVQPILMNHELYDYLTSNITTEKNNLTAVVLITDKNYFHKAHQTIIDIRTRGKWCDTIVLITIDFDLNQNIKDYYNLTTVRFPVIDKTRLLNLIGEPFSDGDGREFTKLNQWEKLHVFDDYFKRWSRIIYFDAGLRVFDSIEYLLELDCNGSILAPNDAGNYNNPKKIFKTQISLHDSSKVDQLINKYGNILESQYFLNCMWVYDTSILDVCNKTQLIDTMNTYPICKTNEMTIMNLLFHFKYKLWKPFPIHASNKKILFEWSELNNPNYSTWRDYCFIKYPVTIPMLFGQN